MSKMDNPGFVYFIRAGKRGPIKIGWAVDPDRRLAALQTATADTLRIIAVERAERTREGHLHHRFTKLRLSGEWFAPGPELLSYILELHRATNFYRVPVSQRPAVMLHQDCIDYLAEAFPQGNVTERGDGGWLYLVSDDPWAQPT